MKKFLILIAAGFFCLFISWMSDTAQKNLDAAHAIYKMIETGDFSKIGDYIAADAVDHAGMTGDVKGLDSIKAELTKMTTMMSDVKNEAVKELADDDYVMSWLKETSKMKVDGMGMKAGETSSMDVIEVSKCKDGKATEHWSFISMGDMMKMMKKH